MSVMRLYQQNRVFFNSALAATPSEDALFPASNVKLRSRYRFWRTAASPPNPVDIDFNCNSSLTNIDAVGLANIRAYRGTAGITSVEVFYGTGGTYPPTWVQTLAPQAIAATDNDVMFDITPPNCRFIRFRLANAGQFSCKPWIVIAADVIALQEGFELRETVRRIRAPESRTLLGGVVFNDLGVGKAQTLTEWRFRDTASTTQKAAALFAQDGSNRPPPMFRDIYGRHIQATVLEPVARWRVSGVEIFTRMEMDYALLQLP